MIIFFYFFYKKRSNEQEFEASWRNKVAVIVDDNQCEKEGFL